MFQASSFKDKQSLRPTGHVHHSSLVSQQTRVKEVNPASNQDPSINQNVAIASTSQSSWDLSEIPSSLELRQIPGRGRGLFASKRGFESGSKIIATTPIVSVLDNNNLHVRCSRCFVSATELQSSPRSLSRCSGCQTVYYCSTPCQRKDWSNGHKQECKAIQNWNNDKANSHILDTPIRALGRVLFAAERDPNLWLRFRSMQSNWSDLKGDEQLPLYRLSMLLNFYLGGENTRKIFGNAGSMLETLSRFQSNAFSLTSPHLDNIGVCISPLVALLNHSCTPNAVVIFPNFADGSHPDPMRVMAIRDIAPGEEILTSYVDLGIPRHMRQKELRETYRFTCYCPKCSRRDPQDPILFESELEIWCDRHETSSCRTKIRDIRLLSDRTSSLSQTLQCPDCNADLSFKDDALAKGLESAEKALDEARSIMDKDPTRALSTLLNAREPLVENHVGLSVFPLLQLHQEAAVLSIELGLHEQAREMASIAWHGVESAYPAGHPVRGIAAATLAKCSMWSVSSETGAGESESNTKARLARVVPLLLKAKAELVPAFGEDGLVVQEMGKMLEEVRLELRVPGR